MKALTVLQPWASLLACGRKKIETRSWKTNYRGKILIHAGLGDPLELKKGDIGVYSNIIGKPYLLNAVNEIRYAEVGNRLPYGVIIGKACLVNCIEIDEEMRKAAQEESPDEYEYGDFTPGRYAWIMEDPEFFEKPVPARGRHGLWNWEGWQ